MRNRSKALEQKACLSTKWFQLCFYVDKIKESNLFPTCEILK